MPTGYTADIPSGITFEQYALNCARAFGATITMRDDPKDTPIPEEFEPSDFYKKEAAKARKEIDAICKMKIADCEKAADKEYVKAELERKLCLKDNREQILSYKAMLEEVKGWTTPSEDHKEFKKFMIEQIESSIGFDDMSDHYSKPSEKLTGKQWKESKIGSLIKSVERYDEEYAKEVDRTNQRNKWVRQLRESLANV